MPYVTAAGHSLYYEVEGEGFPILLHHGFTQSTENWRRAGWVDALARRARVVMFDMLGHGRSDRPHNLEAYRMQGRVEGLLAVADAAGAARFDLLGFSLGGRVAFAAATAHPDRLRSLSIGGMHSRAPRLNRADFERRIVTLRSGRVAMIQRALGTRPAADGTLQPPPDPEALAYSSEALLDWEGAVHGLPEIRTPVFMFAGRRDPIYGPALEDSRMLPDCVFHDAGDVDHRGSFKYSELTLPALEGFLDRAAGAALDRDAVSGEAPGDGSG